MLTFNYFAYVEKEITNDANNIHKPKHRPGYQVKTKSPIELKEISKAILTIENLLRHPGLTGYSFDDSNNIK